MEYSVAGLAENRMMFPQTTKVTILLFIVTMLVSRSVSVTLMVAFTHWFASKYMFPERCSSYS